MSRRGTFALVATVACLLAAPLSDAAAPGGASGWAFLRGAPSYDQPLSPVLPIATGGFGASAGMRTPAPSQRWTVVAYVGKSPRGAHTICTAEILGTPAERISEPSAGACMAIRDVSAGLVPEGANRPPTPLLFVDILEQRSGLIFGVVAAGVARLEAIDPIKGDTFPVRLFRFPSSVALHSAALAELARLRFLVFPGLLGRANHLVSVNALDARGKVIERHAIPNYIAA